MTRFEMRYFGIRHLLIQPLNPLAHVFPRSAFAAAMLPLASALHAAVTCDPRNYGAKGDGTTKDTVVIQHAIDACAGKGRSTVHLSAGTYLSAPIVLKSNILKYPLQVV
jgi:hypothetical protein